MVVSNNDIEGLFQQAFEGYKVEPSPALWTKIQLKLRRYEFFRFSTNKFNIFTLTLLLFLLLTFVVSTSNVINNKTASYTAVSVVSKPISNLSFENTTVAQSDNSSVADNKKVARNQKHTQVTVNQSNSTIHLNKREVHLEFTAKQTDNARTDKQLVADKGNKTNAQNEDAKTKEPNNNDKMYGGGSLNFDISTKSGCAPLKVQLSNTSSMEGTFVWNLGDGNVSSNHSIEYFYEKAGKYPVSLKVITNSGDIFMKLDTVYVYSNPKANFEIENEKKLAANTPVVFKNKSIEAITNEWFFGENSISKERNAAYLFKQSGTYIVKLKVCNSNRCCDSAVVSNLKINAPDYFIMFPNAFTPNAYGSNKGYYALPDMTNEVFHPVAKGVKTYELKIFQAKTGALLFQSNDINIGWDGYYKEKLVDEDVYIWRVSGLYEDGSPYSASGNITILLKK